MDISLAHPIITDEMRNEADRVLQEEFFLGGDSVESFEHDFADYVGTAEAVSINSGTQALHLALRSLGVSSGDTVITTPATFVATGNAILHAGATPEFVDISLETYTIDLNKVGELVKEKSDIAAVLPVHLYGFPVNIEKLDDITGDIPIVADACQAHGATRKGKNVGSLSDISCFSFYPSKNMTVAGDGGMITTDDTEVAELIRSYRNVGRGKETYEHPRVGYTSRMNTINAAIGRKQLEELDDWVARRREIAARYSEELKNVGDLILPPIKDDLDSAWYMYVVRTAERAGLSDHLANDGIETGVHYPKPVHLQPPYLERGYEKGMYPNAEQWSKEILSLPVHPALSRGDVNKIIDSIKSYFQTA